MRIGGLATEVFAARRRMLEEDLREGLAPEVRGAAGLASCGLLVMTRKLNQRYSWWLEVAALGQSILGVDVHRRIARFSTLLSSG